MKLKRSYSEAIETKYEALATDRALTKVSGQVVQSEPGTSHPIITAVRRANCYFMSREIAEAVRSASDSLPEDFVLHGLTLLGEHRYGWMLIDGCLQIPSTLDDLQLQELFPNGDDTHIEALAWSFGEKNGRNVFNVGGFVRSKRGLMWLLNTFMFDGDTIGSDQSRRASALSDEPTRAQALGIIVRFLVSALIWMEQRILITPKERAQRAFRRRLEKQGITTDTVNVIRLRRIQSQPSTCDDPADREWSCQWIVRGHWRLQFYPSKGSHQPVWIMPHVKGPEDKPLKIPGQTVFAVTR